MATSRPFAYNTGSTITGTQQFGNLAIGTASIAYEDLDPGGLQWWNGPDEDLGYVIAFPVPGGDVHTPTNVSASLRFRRSPLKTENSFVNTVNTFYNQSFTTSQQAYTYLSSSGIWTSYSNIVTSGLIIQLDANNPTSYPGTGITVYDLTGSYNHTLTDAPYTTLSGVKCFDCNGATTKIEVNGTGPTLPTTGYTYISWARVKSSSADWRTLFRTLPDDHPILVEVGTDRLGFYDNGGAGFIYSGYDVTSIEDVWVQFAVVGDNVSSIFYINGSQVGTTAYGAGGNRHWVWGGLGGQPFGYVANMYLYNRKLTSSEIIQQYNSLSSRFI